MNKIYLIGSEGSIGSRYSSIIENDPMYRHLQLVKIDIKNQGKDFYNLIKFEHEVENYFIIATPTVTHYDVINKILGLSCNCSHTKNYFLVEKPAFKHRIEYCALKGHFPEDLTNNIFMVNNLLHCSGLDHHYKEYVISYHSDKFGNEDLVSNLSQLIAYSRDIYSFKFWAEAGTYINFYAPSTHQKNGVNITLNCSHVTESYKAMLKNFIFEEQTNLYPFKELDDMFDKIEKFIEFYGLNK